jgi:choline dehydrogenase-like flavoprotein
MTFVGENLPSADNRVVLSKQKDRYGFPLARVTHDYGTDDLTCFDTGMAQGRAIFKSAGAYEVWVSGRATMHIMGRTAQASVTNSYGQAHEIANLFIAGPGLFPTSGAVNPTFTIHALSLRSAEYLLDHWSSVTPG